MVSRPRTYSRHPERDRAILDMDLRGEKREAIAAHFGISPQRVSQIVAAGRGGAIEDPTPVLNARERLGLRESLYGMSPSQADDYLDRAVARECAPPWIRHPQPTT